MFLILALELQLLEVGEVLDGRFPPRHRITESASHASNKRVPLADFICQGSRVIAPLMSAVGRLAASFGCFRPVVGVVAGDHTCLRRPP